ncbi:MAG: zf-HC2 domain-containing protein [Anaerolineae bacterium]|nr:zf-HC2 domain-containing protein [Anaerolineales bacterium]MCQ3972667.1 anti-sigma factor [Anaerolineae bacterium]
MPEPKCRDFCNQLSDYIDGELAASLCAELERHLADCPNCRIVVDTTRKTVSLYRRYGQTELPAGVSERLWQVIEQAGFLSAKNSDPK